VCGRLYAGTRPADKRLTDRFEREAALLGEAGQNGGWSGIGGGLNDV